MTSVKPASFTFLWTNHARHAYVMFAGMRNRSLRLWLASLLILCVLGIYSIEATHYHKNEADEDACAICHVVTHQPLDLTLPPLALETSGLVFLFYLRFWRPTRRIKSQFEAQYDSRAPPKYF